MSKVALNNITGGYAAVDLLNENFDAIEAAFDNTLSRDGSTPNTWLATQDANHQRLINVADPVDGKDAANKDYVINTQVDAIQIAFNRAAYHVDRFNGDGVDTTFTLSVAPGIEANAQVYINGAYQNKNTFSVSGTTLTFTEAPPLFASIEVFVVEPLQVAVADAANITYAPSGGAPQTTVESKLRETVSVKDFGAVGDGVTDDTAAFEAAIVYASANKCTLIAQGSFLINGPINLGSNVVYDFMGATFIAGPSQDIAFRTIGKTNIQVFGGTYIGVAGITAVETSHPTGNYWRGGPFWFEGCTNCHVYYTNIQHFFGAISFYNCSDCSACNNYLSDNAGGIQAVSDDTYAGAPGMRGLRFVDNQILHSGDDALTWLIRNSGFIANSIIANNYISKDPGVNGTIGLSKAIAVYGNYGTGNSVYNCVVADNTGYYMGENFIRAQGAVNCTFTGNTVQYYGALGDTAAYWFGYKDLTTDLSCGDCIISNNTATQPVTDCKAFEINGAIRCRFSSNVGSDNISVFAVCQVQNASGCLFDGNVFLNTTGRAITIDSSCVETRIENNDLSIFNVVCIDNTGTNTYINNNRGYASTTYGNSAVPAGTTSKVVSHGLTTQSTTKVRVVITPTSSSYNATKWWISGYGAGTFTITTDANPTVADFNFNFVATEIV